ncbi:MAG: ABC transporter permease [Actinomycetota bacterium]|nr:ABC transporter permease [Actinomycetota bacterium]MDQ2955547.1 ABC transporter permease [Actinomycetota bacterium]
MSSALSVRRPALGLGFSRRLARLDRVVLACGILLFLLAALAVFGPWIAPQAPDHVDLAAVYAPRSPQHWLGTDASGRDLLSRLIVGARTSLLGPLIVTLVGTVVGSTLGIVSGWCGGWVDAFISRVLDILFAFPGLLMAIVAVALFGAGLTAPIIALSISSLPYMARVVRAATLRERALPYVDACVVQGLSGLAIARGHILRNVTPIVLAQATTTFGYVMIDLAGISYLGLGVQAPRADWGSMAAEGQSSLLRGFPQESLYAGGAIALAVVVITVLGERLSTVAGVTR